MQKISDSFRRYSSVATKPIYRNVDERELWLSDIYTRLNGMMDGREGRPFRPPTDFLREIAGFSSEREIIDLLADEEKASDLPSFDGWFTHGLWKTACGSHVIKKVLNEDAGYMPYARLAILRPDIPLMPRIDAIIEAPKCIYIVMEPLVKHNEIPADNPFIKWDNPTYVPKNNELEELKASARSLFGVQEHYFFFYELAGRILQIMPSEFGKWAQCVREIVGSTGAVVDCQNTNIMFRPNNDGTYSPVMTDPLAQGMPYHKIANRYSRITRFTEIAPFLPDREAFIWGIADRVPCPSRPHAGGGNQDSVIAPD